jgi:hypothetical protein
MFTDANEALVFMGMTRVLIAGREKNREAV